MAGVAGIGAARLDELLQKHREFLDSVVRRIGRSEAIGDAERVKLGETCVNGRFSRPLIRLGLPLQTLAKMPERIMLFPRHDGDAELQHERQKTIGAKGW
jgi:hypothetical protein